MSHVPAAHRHQRRAEPSPLGDDQFLRLTEVAKAMGVSQLTLWRLRRAGRFPTADAVIGRNPLWKVATIRAVRGRL